MNYRLDISLNINGHLRYAETWIVTAKTVAEAHAQGQTYLGGRAGVVAIHVQHNDDSFDNGCQ